MCCFLGTDTFKLTKKVGAGGFSNVYYCEFQEDETEDGVDDAQNAVIALKVEYSTFTIFHDLFQ